MHALEVLEAQPIEVWLLGGFGVSVLALLASSLWEVAAMKRWPVAKGRVLSSKVEQYKEIASSRTTGGSTRMTLYRAVVVYEYDVGGKRYENDRITQSPGLNYGIPELAQKVVQRYVAGAPIDVRFNPRRPGECVLEPRSPSWLAGLVVGLGLVALAIGRAQF
jgi:hypothetical protein